MTFLEQYAPLLIFFGTAIVFFIASATFTKVANKSTKGWYGSFLAVVSLLVGLVVMIISTTAASMM